jgi:hypothetical protein
MSGDALALEKDLDGTWGQLHLNFAAGKAIRHTVEMIVLATTPIVEFSADPQSGLRRN